MLRMQAALLLDKYQHGAHSCNGSQYNDAGKKSEDDIEDEETDYTTTYSTGGPIDVPTLKTHEHQRTLQSLEDRVLRTAFLIRVLHGLRTDTEEQRKSLGSSDEEDTGTDDHHDLLLDILLLVVWAKHPAPYPPCGGRFPSTRPQTVLTCLHVYGFPLVTLLFTIVLNH